MNPVGVGSCDENELSRNWPKASPWIRVGSGFRGHIHRTGRGEFARHIQAGLADLKLLNRAGRNVGGSGSNGLVRDVYTIYFNTSRTPESATKRDRRVASLGGIEVLAILNLYAGLELRQVKEISSIHRQVFNLAGRQNSLNRRLFGIDLKLVGLNFNHGAFLADFKLDAAIGGIVHFYNQ